ncbi:MAG TPA: PilZ domain-containing protein [Sphingomicrobium sp.]|nr:PilZ domain-containing protein [Sphingomicrobium sp.]
MNEPFETTLYSLDPTPPRRRQPRAQRHLSLFRVAALLIGDRRELCLIKNISAGGMLIRAYRPIPVGTELSIELKQAEPVAGTAQWVDQDSVGVAFDQPIDVLSLISRSAEGPQPRMPRIEVDCMATVREGANVVRTIALNISQGGVRVQSRADLPLGAEVVVTLAGLAPEPALVKWRDGDCYGLAFHRVLSITQLVAWLQARHARPAALSA